MGDEGVEATETDMRAAIDKVVEVAELYAEGIDVLAKDVPGVAETAFEAVGSSPQAAWQNYLETIWSVLAESQDKINDSANNLADYTNEIHDVDVENAEGLEGAKHPEGD